MHQNLFAYGDERFVYAKFQEDYKRDHRGVQLMDLIALALVIFLVRDLPKLEGGAIILLGAIVMTRLNTFIDNSNRNFLMHHLNWQHYLTNRRPDDE